MESKAHGLTGRPSNATKEIKRSAALPQLRCTPEELVVAQQAAENANKSMTEWMRSKIFGEQS